MTGSYRYLVRERRSAAWGALAAGLVMLALLVDRGAPIWTWALIAPCIAICILQIALKPGYGIGSRDANWRSSMGSANGACRCQTSITCASTRAPPRLCCAPATRWRYPAMSCETPCP